MTGPWTIECDIPYRRSGRGAPRGLAASAAAVAGTVQPGRVPRVARLMALALRFDELIRSGAVKNQAELARLGHVSRARVSQIMCLLLLAPDIQAPCLWASRVNHFSKIGWPHCSARSTAFDAGSHSSTAVKIPGATSPTSADASVRGFSSSGNGGQPSTTLSTSQFERHNRKDSTSSGSQRIASVNTSATCAWSPALASSRRFSAISLKLASRAEHSGSSARRLRTNRTRAFTHSAGIVWPNSTIRAAAIGISRAPAASREKSCIS